MNSVRAVDAAPLTEGCAAGELVQDDESRSDLPVSMWEAHRKLILEQLNDQLRHAGLDGYHLVWEEVPTSGSRTPDTSRRRASSDSEASGLGGGDRTRTCNDGPFRCSAS